MAFLKLILYRTQEVVRTDEKVKEPLEESKQEVEHPTEAPKEEGKEVEIDISDLPGNENLSAFQIAERKKRTIFVGNIPLDLPAKKLWHIFKNWGKVEKIWFRSIPPSTMITDRRNVVKGKMIGNQKNNKNAYILFESVSSVEEAVKLNNYAIHNSDFTDVFHLRVDRDEKKEDDFKTTIFVGNLPFVINEEELRAHFSGIGEIQNIRIIRDNKTLIGWGIAFIQFATKEEAVSAVKTWATNKKYGKFKGRELRVKKAVPMDRREKKQDRKRDRKQKRKEKMEMDVGEVDQFLKNQGKRTTTRIHNDIKMKKQKRNRMIQEMIEKGGKSKIREGSRKYLTNTIDWKQKAMEKRERRKKLNTENMKKTMKKSDM
jgi:RNA recognition motif-containing protein